MEKSCVSINLVVHSDKSELACINQGVCLDKPDISARFLSASCLGQIHCSNVLQAAKITRKQKVSQCNHSLEDGQMV